MYCRKCGNELVEGVTFCNKCGTKIDSSEKSSNNKQNIKFKVSDVVNKDSVIDATNRVAYIANGWALQVRKRGVDIAIIVGIIYFIMGTVALSESSGGVGAFFTTFGIGLLYAFCIVMVFNTTAFIIRMAGEIIQLLDDIKNNQ